MPAPRLTTAARSDLEQPLPPWRRRLVELSSRGFCRAMLFAAGFWWPRRRGMQHWEEGRRVGAVRACTRVRGAGEWVVGGRQVAERAARPAASNAQE